MAGPLCLMAALDEPPDHNVVVRDFDVRAVESFEQQLELDTAAGDLTR
jgi:hypothetical protein